MNHACRGYTASLTRSVRPWQLADDAATYGAEMPGGPYDTESECWAAIEATKAQAV